MIHFIVGTKAQLIKTAPVMKELRSRDIPYNFIATGQHRETMDDLLDNFTIPKPDHYLYTGPDITGIFQMLRWSLVILWRVQRDRASIFGKDKTGVVLVHGDTFSTLLGALMGKLAGLRVGHIESGLRSFHLFHPFPEELTRIIVFRLSDIFFCPGKEGVANLSGISGEKVDTGGNTLLDAVRLAQARAPYVGDVDVPAGNYAIVTLHRFENFRDRESAERVVSLVERIASSEKLLFILHKPTEIALRRFGLMERLRGCEKVEFRQRYDYFRFLKLLLQARFVVSDGGSNQEECHYLGKPILLLRKATERPEGIGSNACLSRYDPTVIDAFVADVDRYTRDAVSASHSPSAMIVDFLTDP
jgi:UDP-N-acetylglucosamine 2-epimerase (non-hydrolysing)